MGLERDLGRFAVKLMPWYTIAVIGYTRETVVIVSQGLITLVQLSGDWRQSLKKLRAPYNLSNPVAEKIIQTIEARPLPQGKSHTPPYYEELGPYDMGDNTDLTYTNHHWFLTAWIFVPTDEMTPDNNVLDSERLNGFYRGGRRSPRAGLVCSFKLPKDPSLIRDACVPDVLDSRYFRGQLH